MSSNSTNVSPVVEDIVQIWTLASSFCSRALLVIGWIFTKKKGQNCFIFFQHHSSRACSSDYFWTKALSWQVPKRRKWPSNKKELGDEVAACLSGEDGKFCKLNHIKSKQQPQGKFPPARCCSSAASQMLIWKLLRTIAHYSHHGSLFCLF